MSGSGPVLRASLVLFHVGTRFAEFVTIDRLLHQLDLSGVSLDAESVEAAATLRSRVTAVFGDAELVGASDSGEARLAIVLPDARVVRLRTEVAHPSYRFGWGEVSPASLATARALIGVAWSRRWGCEEEMLAEAFVHNVLSKAERTFSFTANSLCDWCLLDSELETELHPSARSLLTVVE